MLAHQRYECGKEAQFQCTANGCFYKTKVKGNLKQHIIKKHYELAHGLLSNLY